MDIRHRGLSILLLCLFLFLFLLFLFLFLGLFLFLILNICEKLHLLPLLLKIRNAPRDHTNDITKREKKKNGARILLSHNHIPATARQEQHSIHAKNIIMLRHF